MEVSVVSTPLLHNNQDPAVNSDDATDSLVVKEESVRNKVAVFESIASSPIPAASRPLRSISATVITGNTSHNHNNRHNNSNSRNSASSTVSEPNGHSFHNPPPVKPKPLLLTDRSSHINRSFHATKVPASGQNNEQIDSQHRVTAPPATGVSGSVFRKNCKNSAPDLDLSPSSNSTSEQPPSHQTSSSNNNNESSSDNECSTPRTADPLIIELKARLGLRIRPPEIVVESADIPGRHKIVSIPEDTSPSSSEAEDNGEDDDASCECHEKTVNSTNSMRITGEEDADRSSSTTSTSAMSSGSGTVVPPGVEDEFRKLYLIAHELTTTEQSFVQVLRLLNVEFRRDVVEKHLPSEVSSVLMKHLDEMHRVSGELLKELEIKLEEWPEKRKIADVLVKIGPFLSVYSFYMRDFETTMSAFEEASKKYPHFLKSLIEFEAEHCKKLKVRDYLLKPIQRIPQYRLLLTDYLKRIPDESHSDYADTKAALEVVCKCADHANNMIGRGKSVAKLLQLQNSLIRHQDIIKPERVFIREGELMKVSRKYIHPRFFVLCSDALLYLNKVQDNLYHLHHELSLTGMRVTLQDDDETHEFIINSPTRSLILRAKSEQERQEWYNALKKAIEENASRRRTFINSRQQPQVSVVAEKGLGEEYPVWVPDERVTMCQICTAVFSLTFRRHHCRACGKVVCDICSSHRMPLKYLNNRKSRVCDHCCLELKKQSTAQKERRKSAISLPTDESDDTASNEAGSDVGPEPMELIDETPNLTRDSNIVGKIRQSFRIVKNVPKVRKVSTSLDSD